VRGILGGWALNASVDMSGEQAMSVAREFGRAPRHAVSLRSALSTGLLTSPLETLGVSGMVKVMAQVPKPGTGMLQVDSYVWHAGLGGTRCVCTVQYIVLMWLGQSLLSLVPCA
jgi:hypothetical protein